MPFVSFKLTNPEAQLGVGDGHNAGWRSVWRIELSDWVESVGLSNGKELRELPGSLHLRPATETAEDGAIGALHFLEAFEGSSDGVARPSPACYSVELQIPAETIRDLFEKEQHGFGPTQATISVPGLSYGSSPGGSAKLWEVEERRNWLAVDGITFSFPYAEIEAEPVDNFQTAREINPTTNAIGELSQKLDELTRKLDKAGLWLIFGGVAVIVTLLAR